MSEACGRRLEAIIGDSMKFFVKSNVNINQNNKLFTFYLCFMSFYVY